MGAAAGAAAGLQVAGGAMGAYSALQMGKTQASYYAFMGNQATAEAGLATAVGENQAENTEKSAAFSEEIAARNATKALGAQRAAEGANGIGGSVTAQNIASSTIDKSELDMEAIRFNADTKSSSQRTNAALTAYGLNTQAGEDAIAGTNSVDASRLNAASSILGSGGSLASMWYRKNQ